jgi:hypothetical protein
VILRDRASHRPLVCGWFSPQNGRNTATHYLVNPLRAFDGKRASRSTVRVAMLHRLGPFTSRPSPLIRVCSPALLSCTLVSSTSPLCSPVKFFQVDPSPSGRRDTIASAYWAIMAPSTQVAADCVHFVGASHLSHYQAIEAVLTVRGIPSRHSRRYCSYLASPIFRWAWK